MLGANVNTIQPTFDGQYYHASPRWRKNVLAFHFLATTITGFGGKVAPPFARSFIGGENDVRGFDFYSITPIAFLPSSASVNVLNPDGSQRVQNQLVNGDLTPVNVAQSIPIYQIITPGGDTHAVFNFEYRIPIVGPISLVPFFDAGMNRILYKNQLTVNPGQVNNLNLQFPEASFHQLCQDRSRERRWSACRPVWKSMSSCPSYRLRSACTMRTILRSCASICSRPL